MRGRRGAVLRPGKVSPNIILEPSAVPHMPSSFARLLEPLDRRMVARAVARHDGDRGVGRGENAWTCARHLKVLLFAQWTGLKSLREMIAALMGQSASFYHLDLRRPCRSTLSDASAQRPAAVFEAIAAALVPVAAGALKGEGAALIRLIASTPILLKGDRFGWAEASARIRGLKLHLVYDPRQDRPVWFALSSAKLDDVVAGRAVPLEKGATYVFDKGYTDYRWWAEIAAAGALFVTRKKRNAYIRGQGERPVEGAAILADRTVSLGHRRPHGGAAPNPLYDKRLREIVVERDGGGAPLVLLTNDFDRPAAQIARLYKERWAIELLFKWLKQNLKIRRFWGRSENAVKIQIYVALIAFMLLRILHQGVRRAFAGGTALLLAQLKVALFRPLDLRHRAKPPPLPPALRPPAPQLRFAFQ
jgi:putative transposase